LILFQISKNEIEYREISPLCTKDANYRPRPNDISRAHYGSISVARNVTAYIVRELDKIGVPVSIMFGTLLHEYRNGTGPCVQENFRDKDFDIAVLSIHFETVVAMTDKILKKFGWKVLYLNEKRLFLALAPRRQKKMSKGFQIDIYGFQSNTPREGLIYFPWDNVTVAMNAFLPLVKHKTLAYDDAGNQSLASGEEQRLYFHKPSNVPCLLSNLYGSDFMTPKKGHFIRQIAYGNPVCENKTLTAREQVALERQLAFGDHSLGSKLKTEVHHGNAQKKIENDVFDTSHERVGIISCIE